MPAYIEKTEPVSLPVIALHGTVAFPQMTINFEAGDESAATAAKAAAEKAEAEIQAKKAEIEAEESEEKAKKAEEAEGGDK